MHMADALVTPGVGVGMYAASALAVGWAVHQTKKAGFDHHRLPMMAVMGAFVFAAQMINFAIPGTGSSGHLGGGMMLAAFLGPAGALLTISSILILQCLLFADGGLLALGANIFNMGVLPVLVVWPLVERFVIKGEPSAKKLTAGAVIGAMIGLQLGAFGVVAETAASGVTELPFLTLAALMQPIHLAIGAIEGVVTAAVLCYVWRVRPDILRASLGHDGVKENIGIGRFVPVLLTLGVAALLTAGVLSHYASSDPDGLEWSVGHIADMESISSTADDTHEKMAEIQSSTAILPDYDFKSATGSGTSAAGLLGALLTAALAMMMGGVLYLYRRKKVSG